MKSFIIGKIKMISISTSNVLLLMIVSSFGTIGGHAHLKRALQSPINVDVSVDCAIRELAWSYAKKLQPQRGNFKSAFDALQLQNCNVSLPAMEKQSPSDKGWSEAAALELYCDCKNGNDDGPGTIEKPVRTIMTAIKLSRKMGTGVAKIIYLREGTCYIGDTIELGPLDSNLTISGYMQEKVVVSGGKLYKFTWEEYKKEMGPLHYGLCSCSEDECVSNGRHMKVFADIDQVETCQTICFKDHTCIGFTYYKSGKHTRKCVLREGGFASTTNSPDCVSGKKLNILYADLSNQNPKMFTSLFINGRRAVRARYPDGNPETMGLHTNPTGYVPKADSWLPPASHGDAAEIHIESPARDGAYFPTFDLAIGGPVKDFDPPESYWGLKSTRGGYARTYTIPTGLQYPKNVDFVNRTWKHPETGVVHAFHGQHWGNWQFQLSGRDMETRNLTFAYGGWQEARGCSYGAEWYVENIMEELDSPNEWFYDDTSKTLFFYPNGSLPSVGVGTVLDELIGFRGTSDLPVTNVSLRNLVFAHTATTFLKHYTIRSSGDWSVYRGGTVFVEGVDGFNLQGCLFDAVGGNGIALSGYVRNAVIRENEFVWSGDSAIVSIGETNLIDGTLGIQPRGTKIIGNLVHENGVFGKQTCAYYQTLSCQTEITGNVFFNGPRAGINFNDAFGGGNHLANNLLFNYVRETSDNGPINTFDRNPYITKVHDGMTPSLLIAQSTITRSFVINNYHSTWPLDHDDGTCYYFDTYNFLVYGGFKNYLGHSKVAEKNVYIYPDADHIADKLGVFIADPYCITDLSPSRTGEFRSGWGDVWANNVCVIGNPDVYNLQQCDPIDPEDLIPFTANNKFYAPNKYIYIRCQDKNLTLEEFQNVGYDIGSTVEDPVDATTIIKWGKELLNM